MVETEKSGVSTGAQKRAVKIVLGTDAGGFDWRELNQAMEFDYYVKYGMTPMQAIRTATTTAAELLAGPTKWAPSKKGSGPTSSPSLATPSKDITELQRVNS